MVVVVVLIVVAMTPKQADVPVEKEIGRIVYLLASISMRIRNNEMIEWFAKYFS